MHEATLYPRAPTLGVSSMGGYAHALSDIFYGVSHIRWAGAVGYEVLSTGPSGTRFANLTEAQKQENGLTQGLCNIFFNDPVPDLLQQARELMFRTALMGSMLCQNMWLGSKLQPTLSPAIDRSRSIVSWLYTTKPGCISMAIFTP